MRKFALAIVALSLGTPAFAAAPPNVDKMTSATALSVSSNSSAQTSDFARAQVETNVVSSIVLSSPEVGSKDGATSQSGSTYDGAGNIENATASGDTTP
jgi:hypothetical protein